MNFSTAIISKSGGRRYNEDYCDYVTLADAGCWVLADGLGGHRGGAVAAHTAVEEILGSFHKDRYVSPESLQRHVEAAQKKLLSLQEEDYALYSMRTTIVIFLKDKHAAVWGHMGDSRLYYFHDKQIVFQTQDHSVPQMLVASGQISVNDIRHHEERNRLLRALGQKQGVRLAIHENSQALIPGDAILLCSDGFWEYVYEEEMVTWLSVARTPEEWLLKMEAILLERTELDNDNYSAIAVFVS